MALLFDESYYLNAKLEQLHAKGEMDASGKPYTMESLVKAISDAGLTPLTSPTIWHPSWPSCAARAKWMPTAMPIPWRP